MENSVQDVGDVLTTQLSRDEIFLAAESAFTTDCKPMNSSAASIALSSGFDANTRR
ncbi:MAG: hypothetical protein ACM3JB_16505 [Acidobacteriaceae bacterium]